VLFGFKINEDNSKVCAFFFLSSKYASENLKILECICINIFNMFCHCWGIEFHYTQVSTLWRKQSL